MLIKVQFYSQHTLSSVFFSPLKIKGYFIYSNHHFSNNLKEKVYDSSFLDMNFKPILLKFQLTITLMVVFIYWSVLWNIEHSTSMYRFKLAHVEWYYFTHVILTVVYYCIWFSNKIMKSHIVFRDQIFTQKSVVTKINILTDFWVEISTLVHISKFRQFTIIKQLRFQPSQSEYLIRSDFYKINLAINVNDHRLIHF